MLAFNGVLEIGSQRHDAIRCVCNSWWQIWVVRGIGGDVCAFAHQQLADSIRRFPEFESLSPDKIHFKSLDEAGRYPLAVLPAGPCL